MESALYPNLLLTELELLNDKISINGCAIYQSLFTQGFDTLGNLYTQPYVDTNASKSFIFFYFDSHKIHLCDYYFQRKYNLTLQ